MINNLDKKQNRITKLNNSKWTSLKKIEGWRHYEVLNINKNEGLVELFAVCDKSKKIIVKKSDLKNKQSWVRGWNHKDESKIL